MNKRKLLAVGFILCGLLGILFTLQFFAGREPRPVTPKEGDYLIYAELDVWNSHPNHQFIMYDPAEDSHVPILPDWNISALSPGPNGRLAFSSSDEGTYAIYTLAYPFTNSEPVKIISDPSRGYHPISWSPDGQYLAYRSFQDGETTLSIWDGESSTQIIRTSASIRSYEMTWSSDGRLAFTIFDTPDGDGSEIYVWDGNKTVNLTQNPTGEDHNPTWNDDGRLAFLSERAGAYDLFIWESITTINGLPDVSSFIKVAPLKTSYSMPAWSNSGLLTFQGYGPSDDRRQIYEWDGVRATNISQNPDFDNVDPHWRNDGYWSHGTGLGNEQLVYILDHKNKSRLILEGYGARWSDSGYFAFCQRTITGLDWYFPEWGLPKFYNEYDGWTLSLGNGRKITEIVQGKNILAVWANGEEVFCSSG